MSIKQDFKEYWDSSGLVGPGPYTGSGNGPMYTSEFFIILRKNQEDNQLDSLTYSTKIAACVNSDGTLNRYNDGAHGDQEQVDDYYAVLHGCMVYNNTYLPRRFLLAMIKGLGCLNNVDGKWNFDSFLARQPQLIACMVAASFPSLKNPLHWLIRILAFPLFAYSALLWLFSGAWSNPDDTDARRLAWHVIGTLAPVSLLNSLTSKLWYRRLNNTYAQGMRTVAFLYYQPRFDNPFGKHWVD